MSTVCGSGPVINEEGFLSVNGSAFIPVGAYDVNGREAAISVRDSGLNCAESMLADVDGWAANAGLYYIRWMIARMKTEEEISELVKSCKEDERNLAWYTFDEPNEVGISPEECSEVYDIIKKIDPGRPVMLTVSPAYWYHPWSYSEYAGACDVISTDPYPVEIGHGIGMDYVSEAVGRARHDSGKPVWAVLQAFPWPGKRLPTPDELRCMTYQALVHGASGILYYTYQVDAWNYSLAETPLWEEVARLAGEISALNLVLTTPGTEADVTSGIHSCEHHLGNSTYIIAVNVRSEEANFYYPIPVSVDSIDVIFEERSLPVSGGIMRDIFTPYSTRVYRMGEVTALTGAIAGLFGASIRRRRDHG